MFFFILFACFFLCLFFCFQILVEQIFRGTEIFSFFDQSKRGFKFLLKHDWLKKIKFWINGSINLEHFVNKFHSPSLINFLLRLLCGVKKLIHLEENKQEADSFKISANMPCSKKFETS